MNQSFGLPMIAIGVLCAANICLLMTAAFSRGRASHDGTDATLRVTLGYVAVSLGLCSQILYGLMVVAWRHNWMLPDPGHDTVNQLQIRISNMGALLSAATLLVALSGRGLRRLTSLWVGATNWFLWGLFGFGAGLSEALNGLLRDMLRGLLGGR